MLASALLAPDDQVRLVLESGVNPLAILELPRGLTPTQLAGGFGLPIAVPLQRGIEDGFARRLAKLTRDAQLLMLMPRPMPPAMPRCWACRPGLGSVEAAAVEAQ